jgi:hypothetical protein
VFSCPFVLVYTTLSVCHFSCANLFPWLILNALIIYRFIITFCLYQFVSFVPCLILKALVINSSGIAGIESYLNQFFMLF